MRTTGTGASGEIGHLHRFPFDLQAAGFEPNEIQQIVNQFEEPHSIGLHGGEQAFCFRIKLPPKALHQILQRREQQR